MVKYCIFIFLLLASCTTKNQEVTINANDFPKNDSTITLLDSSLIILEEKIKNHIQDYADKGQFSGSVLVAKGGTILFKGAFGYEDFLKKSPNRIHTKYLIGSTTKSFTAVALLRYYEKGLVSLNAPIAEYLPNLNRKLADKLTLDILLRMQSGLPNHLKRLTKIEEKQITTDEIIEIINTAELEYEPGTQYSYSNLNYHLIAAILEKKSGLSFDQILKEEIFNPLDMMNSGSGKFDSTLTNRAFGYYVGELTRTEDNNLTYALGSGNIYSTIEDIYKWDQALYDNEYLSEESKKIAFNGGSEEFGYYGYGFRIREYERTDSTLAKGVLVRHGGMMKGYLANVHRYLDDKITVIVLGNISMFPIRELTTELKDLAMEKKK